VGLESSRITLESDEGKEMRIFRVSLLACVAFAVGSQGWAQIPVHLSKKERISLCEHKQDVPFDPADPKPLEVDEAKAKATRPVILHQVTPHGGFASRLSGKAVIEAVIDEDGCVRQPRITEGQGTSIAAAGLDAIRKWVFEPATVDGRPVRVVYYLTFNVH
jgi:TonB family protein